ncbi:Type 1 glutamine amidotransferase-like domain-containing protein [Homoserinibacter sp. YIM 151385]|uniref:Type 1 glutamine amidotransferase-like domain-containing protein n=1 Tax=Homoserinibacter sp. YIM 151385 TaxID=2985506 RepID=UPI0022F05C9E|nr:Type 1 glutamine amidotransferase-like domain-containing protein [Homoserinibacter sp. YIM 151385]WBU38249.1 Type 1 glutamine amidotransferase-like domain-containing protein [Homoserinibacter sp. YIM 151385]
MSIHLVGGGWSEEGIPERFGPFVAEAAARAAGSGRMVPRIGVLLVDPEEEPGAESAAAEARYRALLLAAGACEPVVTTAHGGEPFPSGVLSDIDALFVGGGLTPAYLEAILPIVDEVRLLVSDGLPYLGFSAGAMIAPDRAIVGGWRIGGIPVCAEDCGEDLDEVAVVEGLGLIDIAVDVHAAQWGTLTRLVATTEAGLVDGGVAIDEDTALIVGDELRVVGLGNVWQVVDGEDGVVVSSTA